jgi:L-methionine (R)-S-oxide reductase
MDDQGLQTELTRVVSSIPAKESAARRIAWVIATRFGYRWVGIYEVGKEEIFVLGWDGPRAPAHPRFPRTKGLCGQAVLSRAAVRVDDVTKDPDYLTTHESTRAELVVPVLTTGMEVVGVIDVESDQVGAFGEQDVGALQACAAALRPLWTG